MLSALSLIYFHVVVIIITIIFFVCCINRLVVASVHIFSFRLQYGLTLDPIVRGFCIVTIGIGLQQFTHIVGVVF